MCLTTGGSVTSASLCIGSDPFPKTCPDDMATTMPEMGDMTETMPEMGGVTEIMPEMSEEDIEEMEEMEELEMADEGDEEEMAEPTIVPTPDLGLDEPTSVPDTEEPTEIDDRRRGRNLDDFEPTVQFTFDPTAEPTPDPDAVREDGRGDTPEPTMDDTPTDPPTMVVEEDEVEREDGAVTMPAPDEEMMAPEEDTEEDPEEEEDEEEEPEEDEALEALETAAPTAGPTTIDMDMEAPIGSGGMSKMVMICFRLHTFAHFFLSHGVFITFICLLYQSIVPFSGCAPENSEMKDTCECPEGTCFDPVAGCVAVDAAPEPDESLEAVAPVEPAEPSAGPTMAPTMTMIEPTPSPTPGDDVTEDSTSAGVLAKASITIALGYLFALVAAM